MLGALLAAGGCAVVNQGEVGLKRRAGKIDPVPLSPGLVRFEPVLTDIIKVPIRTVNREVQLSLPSKDGINVAAEISILYRVKADKALDVIATIGENYEDVVILSVFRSAAADTCARYAAKDMYTASRGEIEREIQSTMSKTLEPRGFVIESVLLKSIQLPQRLTSAIEQKLQADQEAQRMEFMLDRERLEAERKKVEAQGIRESQRIIGEGLSPAILQWQAIQAFRELAESPNAKVIITDGKTPALMPGAVVAP